MLYYLNTPCTNTYKDNLKTDISCIIVRFFSFFRIKMVVFIKISAIIEPKNYFSDKSVALFSDSRSKQLRMTFFLCIFASFNF